MFILAKALTYVLPPLSGGPLILIAGALFGFVPGVIYALAGDVLGGTINFWIARIIGRPAVQKISGKKALKEIDNFVHKLGDWKALLAARVVLSSLYDYISYAAGFSNLKYKTYFWVTLIGGIPGLIIGVGTGTAIVRHPLIYIGFLVLSVGSGAVYFWLRQHQSKKLSTDKVEQ